MNQSKSFTGRHSNRRSTFRVRAADKVARTLITLGGIGTIIAVSLVCVFLVSVVIPLFGGSSIERTTVMPGVVTAAKDGDAGVIHLSVDEYNTMGWVFFRDGSMATFDLDSGGVLKREQVFPAGAMTAWAFNPFQGEAAFGFRDGTMRQGRLGFASQFFEIGSVPDAFRDMGVGESRPWDDGVLQRTGTTSFRKQTVAVDMAEGVSLGSTQPVVLIDQVIRPAGPVVCVLTSDGKLQTKSISQRRNLLTGEVTTTLVGGEIDKPQPPGRGLPDHLLLTRLADSVYLIWNDGYMMRFDTRNIAEPVLAETGDLVPEAGATITALTFMIGRSAIVTGDSSGAIRAWYRVRTDEVGEGAATRDGTVMRLAHELPPGPAAVTSLTPSARTRLLAAGFADGSVRLYHTTSDQLLVESLSDTAEPANALALSPRNNGLVGVKGDNLVRWGLDTSHAEITLASIVQPVWYEGYAGPAHVWQSSGGTDDFEPKYGLRPLVFGTLKATFYSMLFGAPLAILAAIYTAEFMHRKTRAKVKPAVEMMASLPSVVLGFLAALVIAPFVESYLPETLSAFVTVPVSFLTGAYLWQLLPGERAAKLAGLRFPLLCLSVLVGLALAVPVGPLAERVLFAGDIKAWLDGQIGSGAGGWMFILLPVAGLITAFLIARFVHPWMRDRSESWTVTRFAGYDALVFLIGLFGTLLLAFVLSHLANTLLWDPRGSYVDTFVQRNALVVGFIMGFAIIPIIYTISEDALSAVPEHLRAASLGAGATPWQTAVRVIIPTAASGLFSAMMIGLGRAVGETMIVLMAAGNTPVMEWNIFNGFRTLSANIAVELPEAVQGSTHYRMLFLAALTLFAMTFMLNTVAEVIRQRFRKRAFQL